MSALEHELKARFGARLAVNEPLGKLTSFGIGGPADLLLTVENEAELSAALFAADRAGAPAFCLGAGTNLLVSDRGIRGLVIRLGKGLSEITVHGSEVSAGSAAMFGQLVERAVACGLAGLEFGEGIPGTVGGGLIMNAGAFGGEIARVVERVHGVTREGEKQALRASEVGFAYRRTELPPGFIITRVDFKLALGERQTLFDRAAGFRAKRAARQPRGVPNAGSIFKNPPGEFAGRLLEGAGLKGRRFGDAAFSPGHANFIVNLGAARAEDVRALMDLARARVGEVSGIWLEPEVRLVGEW